MDRVLIIISDNNKGRIISKGFSYAFSSLSYFVYERKVCDLNIEEIKKLNPEIIFVFWTDMNDKKLITEVLSSFDNKSLVLVNCAEKEDDIPAVECFAGSCYNFYPCNGKYDYKYCVNAIEYKTKFSGYKYGITFTGNPAQDSREKLLLKIISNFGPVNIFCKSYDFYKSLDEISDKKLADNYILELYRDSYKGYVKTEKELAKIYSESKINLDMPDENKPGINFRTLEITASGGFCLAHFSSDTVKYFENGKDIETYLNDDDLIDKIRFYEQNLNLALMITANGKRNTVSNHFVTDRLKEMLKVIYDKNIDG